MNITNKIRNNATPVGFAQPPTRPNSPGLVVNNHSEIVKLFLFITGSLTTTKAIQHNHCSGSFSSTEKQLTKIESVHQGVPKTVSKNQPASNFMEVNVLIQRQDTTISSCAQKGNASAQH